MHGNFLLFYKNAIQISFRNAHGFEKGGKIFIFILYIYTVEIKCAIVELLEIARAGGCLPKLNQLMLKFDYGRLA